MLSFTGDYHRLVADLRKLRKEHFFSAFRMTPLLFDKLLNKLRRRIRKQTTR